jgi:hypothetical protein
MQACVEHGANYCDLSAEAPWIRKIIDEFHEKAAAKGIRIVHACGFDSVPSEVLTLAAAHYMHEKHGKSLDDVTLMCHDCVPSTARMLCCPLRRNCLLFALCFIQCLIIEPRVGTPTVQKTHFNERLKQQ